MWLATEVRALFPFMEVPCDLYLNGDGWIERFSINGRADWRYFSYKNVDRDVFHAPPGGRLILLDPKSPCTCHANPWNDFEPSSNACHPCLVHSTMHCARYYDVYLLPIMPTCLIKMIAAYLIYV